MALKLYADRNGYTVKCKLFETIDRQGNKLIYSDEYKTFYAKDLGFETNIAQNGLSKRRNLKGTIETIDLKETDIDIDFRVEYSGKYYIVKNLKFEDNNNQKKISKRPNLITTIELLG